jgi:hypothetical protein
MNGHINWLCGLLAERRTCLSSLAITGALLCGLRPGPGILTIAQHGLRWILQRIPTLGFSVWQDGSDGTTSYTGTLALGPKIEPPPQPAPRRRGPERPGPLNTASSSLGIVPLGQRSALCYCPPCLATCCHVT